MSNSHRLMTGFTLVELLLAMGIATVIFGISSILLSNLIPRASLNSTHEVLKAEIRQQQLSAMTGKKDGSGQANSYGVLIEQDKYTLFSGSEFSPLPVDSIVVDLPSTISLSTNFPNNVIIFERGNGEISNFDPTAKTITIVNSLTGESRNITLNRYGLPE